MNSITQYLYQYYDEVEAYNFYRDIFPEGEFQKKGEYRQEGDPYKYNGVLVSVTNRAENGKAVVKRSTVTDDLEAIKEACKSSDFTLMSPISYVGKERTAKNARYLYAVVIDLDYIIEEHGAPVGLMGLLERHVELVGRLPKPTYIVSSGTGAHLYYVLEKPVALYPETVKQLQTFKHDLTRLVWHDTIVSIESEKDIQQESIFQGFRVVGTITKTGTRARAFWTGEKVTMDYLNRFIPEKSHRVADFREKKKGLTLADAKKRYPEWYERRIVKNEEVGKRKPWHSNRALYDWWKRKVLEGAAVGHRYHCIRILAIYAQKCSYYDEEKNPNPVTREELEKDIWNLFDFMEAMTNTETNHFTTADVLDALESYNENWVTYPIKEIQATSGISVLPNKRNGRPRAEHIKIMNFIRDEINHNLNWRDGNGRKPKTEVVRQWRQLHPDGKKADCIRETGLSKPTVYKWWDA